MSDGLNDARAMRVAEIMSDFRNLQHYLLSQIRVAPTAEEFYLEGYSLLRECQTDARAILQTEFAASPGHAGGNLELEKQQLKAIIVDAAVRRFQCQRLYLRAHVGIMWVDTRNGILRGQKPNASHFDALQQADATLRSRLVSLTDAYVETTLRAADAAQQKFMVDDPSLAQIQQILLSRR